MNDDGTWPKEHDVNEPLFRLLLPPAVTVAESFGDVPSARLMPGEEAAVVDAVAKRRQEYATGRHCARKALAGLGLPGVPIPSGPDRQPLWPAGIVGSITHCAGYRAAATARADAVASLGIDAEPDEALPAGVLAAIARPEETSHLAGLTALAPYIHWDRLLFCAKEAAYKAWFPLAHTWLGFEDAGVRFDGTRREFVLTVHRPGPMSCLQGRWRFRAGLLLTAVVVGESSDQRDRRGDAG